MLNESLIGIVTGIITTWILFLGKVIWDSKVTPFIRETRYQGVKVDGAWSGANSENECRLYLAQSAHELGGSFSLKYIAEPNRINLDFDVRGYMWEGYLTLNFIPKDRRVTSYATALLKLHNGGLNLEGQWCFRNVHEEKVEVTSISLSREQATKL